MGCFEGMALVAIDPLTCVERVHSVFKRLLEIIAVFLIDGIFERWAKERTSDDVDDLTILIVIRSDLQDVLVVVSS
ncbi:hypothetical protein CFHF_24925 [Caulobacter flavus]|uniref:Uncharacterized protein n=1 Tax=Caulobacter flavus TaxID=1679497 RepID=A0A2N5CL56_9CAUL|nr:hypothetical protein C1707_19555 [Caulobacter flavus]PLR06441.1 hypothetical protein CFHF_24925 [Caulobacter flavus]